MKLLLNTFPKSYFFLFSFYIKVKKCYTLIRPIVVLFCRCDYHILLKCRRYVYYTFPPILIVLNIFLDTFTRIVGLVILRFWKFSNLRGPPIAAFFISDIIFSYFDKTTNFDDNNIWKWCWLHKNSSLIWKINCTKDIYGLCDT